MSGLRLFILLTCYIHPSIHATHAVNVTEFRVVVPEQFKLRNATHLTDHVIKMLTQNQTDYIKKIVSNEKEKKVNNSSVKIQPDVIPHRNVSLEEYNHCRYLQYLFNETQSKNKSNVHPTRLPIANELYKNVASATTHTSANIYPKEVPIKPSSFYFVTQPVPFTASSTKHPPIHSTSRSVSTTTSENKIKNTTEDQYFFTHTPNPKPHIKYVQYETAILQKVVMDDGKVMYYRYNNPSMSYYPPWMYAQSYHANSVTTESIALSTPDTEYSKQTSTTHKPQESTTPKEVTEATTKLPNYDVDYGTPSNPYANTMKFVIPVPYTTNNGITTHLKNYPWYFINPYRNPIQRSDVPVAMPYVPMYNMIRTLTIPK